MSAPIGTQMVVHDPRERDQRGESMPVFASKDAFVDAANVAKSLSSSSMIPTSFQGKPANCLVAMELANRTRASVLMVMQNLHIINGRPSWSASFLIGSINSCGRFSPLRFESHGDVATAGWKVRATARDIATGEILEGEWITWEMANAEGWVTRKDSKWKTMPGQMIRYRAAAFWVRVFAPEVSLGMRTADEAEDMPAESTITANDRTAALNAALRDIDAVERMPLVSLSPSVTAAIEVVEVPAAPTPAPLTVDEEIRRDDAEVARLDAEKEGAR